MKKSSFLKIGAFAACAIFLVSINQHVSYAESGNIGISVDRPVFNVVSDAGSTDSSVKFNVQNNTAQASKISITPFDYTIGDENRIFPLEYYSNDTNSLREWLSVDQGEFVLGAGEKKEVTASVNVPNDAIVGSHWGGIMVNFAAVDQQVTDSDSSLLVGGQIGIHVLLNVNGETNGAGKLNTFEAPLFVSSNAVFSSEYEDIGNIHYIPHGEIAVKNFLSGSAHKIMLEKHFAFPGKKLTYTAQLDSGLSWVGTYSAQNIFVDGNGNVHTQTRYMFGVLFFPFLFLAIIFLIFFVRFFKKRK